MANKFVIGSLEELDRFVQEFAGNLKGNEIILLEGELGAGKTTFTKYLLRHLGIGDDVVSPTFVLMNEYHGKFDIYHIDMYRVDSFDISDIAGRGLILIEWPKESYTNYEFPVIKIQISVKDGVREFSVERLS